MLFFFVLSNDRVRRAVRQRGQPEPSLIKTQLEILLHVSGVFRVFVHLARNQAGPLPLAVVLGVGGGHGLAADLLAGARADLAGSVASPFRRTA